MVDYRKSYSQSRADEQAAIKDAISKVVKPNHVEPNPDSTWLKIAIQNWLTSKSIKWKSSMNKAELLELIR